MADNKNLELYNKFRAVPSDALKAFDNGRFKGTDINTMWRVKMLTSEFGACGCGWYYEIKRLWTEEVSTGERLAFAEIDLYVKFGDEWGKPITGVGGNRMVSYVVSKKTFNASDEAYKMAITDALGNACKYLGIGADVYWENDKTKYTTAEKAEPVPAPSLKDIRRKQILAIQKQTGITNAELKAIAVECDCIDLDKAPKHQFDEYLERLKNWEA